MSDDDETAMKKLLERVQEVGIDVDDGVEADFIICKRAGDPTLDQVLAKTNRLTKCVVCNTDLVVRPYVPHHIKTICIACTSTQIGVHEDVRVTPQALMEALQSKKRREMN